MKSRITVRAAIVTVIVSVVLALLFGAAYLNDRAWGAWGDDSAGYIYLAGRMFAGLPLVYHDPLGAQGLAFFGDERLARWLIPQHNQFINPSGTVASKYPVGLSLLMADAARIVGSTDGFYLINPLFATTNIVLVYLVALCAFAAYRYKHLVGFGAATAMGLSTVYYEYALAQPMREIPSITFLLLTALCLFWFARVWGGRKRFITLATMCAGFSFGMAINVRETSMVVLPAIIVFVWMATKAGNWKQHVRALIPSVALFILTVTIAIWPTIHNSISISEQKVVFKPRDTSRVVLLSNIGHLQTLSIKNIFHNDGKFRPGTGALPDYWDVIRRASPIHFFIVLVAVGIIFLWRESRAKTLFLVLWIATILGIFSLWINPYSRYVLPLFPPVFLFGAYGFARIITDVIPLMWKQRSIRILTSFGMIAIVFCAYQPVIATAKENYNAETHIFKAISESDLRALQDIGKTVGITDKSVLMFSGSWQYGTSETFEAHTGVRGIRFPLDQRFVFTPGEVEAFFDQMLAEGYDLYVWIDPTSSSEALEWLGQHNVSSVYAHDFSYQHDVHVYHVNAE